MMLSCVCLPEPFVEESVVHTHPSTTLSLSSSCKIAVEVDSQAVLPRFRWGLKGATGNKHAFFGIFKRAERKSCELYTTPTTVEN